MLQEWHCSIMKTRAEVQAFGCPAKVTALAKRMRSLQGKLWPWKAHRLSHGPADGGSGDVVDIGIGSGGGAVDTGVIGSEAAIDTGVVSGGGPVDAGIVGGGGPVDTGIIGGRGAVDTDVVGNGTGEVGQLMGA
mmetsp:Transcript_16662/g.35279  ORF Transcript_16662/g.35279 Transcript_16662/m.35279 type:complete len:134 (-) Transcript_16662:982-1383(-)